MKLNFADVQTFDPIPSNRYHVKVTDYGDVETKNEGKLPAGTPGINWEFTVQSGDHADRKLWTNHWIHPKTLGFLKSMLKATGRYTDEQLESEDFDFEPSEVVGADLIAVVAIRPYEGEDRNDIRRFLPYSEEALQTADAGASSMLP